MNKKLAGITLAAALAVSPVAATTASAEVPAISKASYVIVKSGDTLSGIASAHHTTWQHLAAVNHLSNPNHIYPGQKIYLSGSHTTTHHKPPVHSKPSGQKVVNQASKYIGTPYVWGGTSTSGMDCSGLTYTTFKALGKKIPRVADAQYWSATKVSRPKTGDLVFVHDSSGHIYHVGIYVNSSKWLEAERPGKGVNYYRPWTKSVYYGRYTVK